MWLCFILTPFWNGTFLSWVAPSCWFCCSCLACLTSVLMATAPAFAWHLQEAPHGHEDCLTGKTFVITGIMDSLTRTETEDFIKRHGGKVRRTGGCSSGWLACWLAGCCL